MMDEERPASAWPAELHTGLDEHEEALAEMIRERLSLTEIGLRLQLAPEGLRTRLGDLYPKAPPPVRAAMIELLLDSATDAGPGGEV